MCDGKTKCQFPEKLVPYLGKNWKPLTKEQWYEALVKAKLLTEGEHHVGGITSSSCH